MKTKETSGKRITCNASVNEKDVYEKGLGQGIFIKEFRKPLQKKMYK